MLRIQLLREEPRTVPATMLAGRDESTKFHAKLGSLEIA
jgi:hypothetical protein